ncbi:MAG TPA: HNH endonuclease signature motif containing protein [Acidimicrobiales bacterium]|jgi:5-methylcytosine-specific restriction protein A
MSDPYQSLIYKRARPLVLAAANWRCQIRGPRCKVTATTVDHIIPLALGGSHTPENLRAACTACNCGAGAAISSVKRQGRQVGRNSRRW